MALLATGAFAAGPPDPFQPNAVAIEWFAEGPGAEVSYLEGRADASGEGGTLDCTVAMHNEPKAPQCAWCQQQLKLCERQEVPARSAGSSGSFTSDEKSEATHQYRDGPVVTMKAVGRQQADFTPNSMRVANLAESGADGGSAPLRGIGYSEGRVYFRVPGPVGAHLTVKASMEWTVNPLSNQGHFQIHAIPNTGADLSVNLGMPSSTASSPYRLDESRALRPGLYVVKWHVGTDAIGAAKPRTVSLDFELNLEPLCGRDRKDTDGDGLRDEWETIGILVSSGECVPSSLVFEGTRLPDPKVMDIYVELDQAKAFELSSSAISLVQQAFRDTDARRGPKPAINLHVLVDEEVAPGRCVDLRYGARTDIQECGGLITDGAALLDRHFGTEAQRLRDDWPAPLTWDNVKEARKRVFHHAMAVDTVVDDSNDEPYARPDGGALRNKPDFFVAVGKLQERLGLRPAPPKPPDPNTPGIGSNCSLPKFDAVRLHATTFMHELGHTLGLWHGGNCSAGQPGCFVNRPNYRSIMGYTYGTFASTSGASCNVGGVSRWLQIEIDFSREELPPLNECNLQETAGLGASQGNLTGKWIVFPRVAPNGKRTYEFAPADGPIDWNRDGDTNDTIRGLNLHSFDPEPCTVLEGHNDWLRIQQFMFCRVNFPDDWCPKER